MRIVLIGFMGSGKSSVGALLAEHLGFQLHEMDQLLVARSEHASIAEIFESHGEIGFRELEANLARELSGSTDAVVSTGGGIIFRDDNMTSLGGPGSLIIYLRTPFRTLLERVVGLESRPLFKDKKSAEDLYQRRAPVYERWADIIVDTDGKTPEQVCAEIVSKGNLKR